MRLMEFLLLLLSVKMGRRKRVERLRCLDQMLHILSRLSDMIHVHYTMTNDCMCVGSWEEVLIVEPNLEVWFIAAFASDEIQAQ